jgi:hypothetical protein
LILNKKLLMGRLDNAWVRLFPVTARNPQAVERGQAHREQIKAAMLEHVRRYPLRRPLTGKELQARFPHLALSSATFQVDRCFVEEAMPP